MRFHIKKRLYESYSPPVGEIAWQKLAAYTHEANGRKFLNGGPSLAENGRMAGAHVVAKILSFQAALAAKIQPHDNSKIPNIRDEVGNIFGKEGILVFAHDSERYFCDRREIFGFDV